MTIVQFDQVARSERYFADTLLPHLLMADDFARLKLLFAKVYPHVDFINYQGAVELVSELDPLRDGSVYNTAIKKLFQLHKRVAVPDLFLRWGDYCIVIEAKLFTDPLDIAIDKQIAAQQDAIAKVKSETIYQQMNIVFLVVSMTQYKNLTNAQCIFWGDLLNLIQAIPITSIDLQYCLEIFQNAIQRATSGICSPQWEKIPSLNALLAAIPRLLSEKKTYIGFKGGERALRQATWALLTKRRHYKVADTKISDNWLPMHIVLQRIMEIHP